jgi:hypothetical protein
MTEPSKTDGRFQSETTAAAFRAGVPIHQAIGAPLYAALCAGCADAPELVDLASRGQPGAQPMHLFSSVYDLLLADPSDPLSRFYVTFTDEPAPAAQAFPEFRRFCREHREAIVERLENRTVQSTYVERCRGLLPAFSVVADRAGEPLNLIEIGTSAGVLLTFDKYEYDLGSAGRLSAPEAPLTLKGEVRGAPTLHIPRIGARIGLDLNPLDPRQEDQRRWVIALIFPEFRDRQANLAKSLDVVAATDVQFVKGDALDLLPAILVETPSPVCVFHSTCLMYWSPEAKAALDMLLRAASREREIWRVGIEPASDYDAWYAGRAKETDKAQRAHDASWGEVTIGRYASGAVESRVVAGTSWDGGVVDWSG